MQSYDSYDGPEIDRPQTITANGCSMFPIIVKGDRIALKICKDPVVLGDIVLAKLVNGQWVIHRVVNTNPIETKGDANESNDLKVADVVASVVKIEKTVISRLRRTGIWKKLSWLIIFT